MLLVFFLVILNIQIGLTNLLIKIYLKLLEILYSMKKEWNDVITVMTTLELTGRIFNKNHP